MKRFWQYLFPAFYGFLTYATIRLINDSLFQEKPWERPWTLNAIEIFFTLLMGYVMYYALQWLFRRFDRSLSASVGYQTVLQELFWVFVISEVCINAIMTPMVALTDDGLS